MGSARTWKCQRRVAGVVCGWVNDRAATVCAACSDPRDGAIDEAKNCTRCGELLPLEEFYFVSRKLGTRRGQCKACVCEVKAAQQDPGWRPRCAQCGAERERVGMGRRLCHACFHARYDAEATRLNGAHQRLLKPCRGCGAERLREDEHALGTSLCPVCRSITPSRRKRLRAFFNLTVPQFLALLDAQGHRCAICGRKPAKPMHVDHRHSAPRIIRGMLCATCNTLLGAARDDPERLRRAAHYLEDPPAQKILPRDHEAHAEANRKDYNPITRGRGRKR